jgi:lipoate-protein ligase A
MHGRSHKEFLPRIRQIYIFPQRLGYNSSMEKSFFTYPRAEWRLILSPPLPGSINMAVDSAILAAVEEGISPPTLRLYSWDPPCLSLGYSQPFSDIDQDRLIESGWDIVRRPTGGRAILHTDELTYSVIGPKTDPRLGGGLMESYRRISQALFDSLVNLELPVMIHQGKNPLANNQPVCFENPSDFEITVEGRKIIGSAQARKMGALLQHGSLPLYGDLTRITQVLKYQNAEDRNKACQTLLEKAATVADILGRDISWQEAADAFRSSFSRVLNLDLKEEKLSAQEDILTRDLQNNKYDNEIWTRGTG